MEDPFEVIPITDQELEDFVYWMHRTIDTISKQRGTLHSTTRRRHQLLNELRIRGNVRQPVQMEMFP